MWNIGDGMSKRSDKITALSEFCDLESGSFYDDAFPELAALFEKGRQYRRLVNAVCNCDKCEGLNVKRLTEAVPGWGNLNAEVMFVGQSLHDLGVYSGIPFILGSGLIVDAALRLSGIKRHDCFWTNAVLCHPERNRPSTDDEKENCLGYLFTQIDIVQPKVVVALGKDAEWAVGRYVKESGCNFTWLKYVHPASLIYSSPESRPNYIVKMSLDLEKALWGSSCHREMVSEEQGFAGSSLLTNENLPPNNETHKALLGSLKPNRYKTIYIDPPWPEVGGGKIKRGADKHYKVMSINEIASYGSLINTVAKDECHLYLWATNNYLKDAFKLLEQWGFQYITMITWMKDRKGLGQYYRGKTEHCLFARKGVLPYRKKNGKRAQGVTGFVEKRGRHSAKPETMREMIETVSYPPRLEMFAREKHKGWDVWGNEV
jgi:uracil-DNA glycosylase family 4